MASSSARRKQDSPPPKRRTGLKLVAKPADEMPEEEYLEHIAEFAETLNDKELLCRRLNAHDLVPFTVTVNVKTLAMEEVMRCRRCKTLRKQDMSGRGMVAGSRYKHPKGYLDKGHGRLTPAARGILRVTSALRGNVIWVDDEGNPTKPPSQTTLKKAFREARRG